MGILSIVCCNVLGPVTWIMSNNALTAGAHTPEEANLINIARILGIIGTVLLVIGCLWVVLGGGLAAIGAATGGGAATAPGITPGVR